LQTALEFEKKCQKLYSDASKKTDNPISKRTFDYLAEQEINHVREIEIFVAKTNPDLNLDGDTPKETEGFFKMTLKDFKKKTLLSQDDKAVYLTAMELEQSAYEFYEAELKKAKDEKVRKFFQFLIVQENAHYALLSKTLDFIKHPDLFFARDESWNFEG
jgi:rubrerythrin